MARTRHRLCAVHPRVGGKQGSNHGGKYRVGGSSPRGRGTGQGRFAGGQRLRFIPAWAGNSLNDRTGSFGEAVHPRVGGEQNGSQGTPLVAAGSSPRGRGTGSRCLWVQHNHRFIPAWAGNRRPCNINRLRRTVHPRVGGEQAARCSVPTAGVGSSPRGRGTVDRPLARGQNARFIPAWAGNSRRR